MHRLEGISPDLVTMLRNASPAKLQAAMLVACEFAVSHSGIIDAAIDRAISELRLYSKILPQTRSQMQLLAEQHDTLAFRAQEATETGEGSAEEYVAAFARARCYTAISSIDMRDPQEAALDTIYEAAMTTDDPQEIVPLIQSILA